MELPIPNQSPAGFKSGSVLSLSVSVVALLFSAGSFFWLLPLQSANVVVEANDIQIQNTNGADFINLALKNIGHTEATQIRFRLYVMQLSNTPTTLVSGFDDRIIHPLVPDESVEVGQGILAYPSSTLASQQIKIGNTVASVSEQFVLILSLTYVDGLTGHLINRVFFYQYHVGGKQVGALIGADYSKIYPSLKTAIETSTFNDPFLAAFVRTNTP